MKQVRRESARAKGSEKSTSDPRPRGVLSSTSLIATGWWGLAWAVKPPRFLSLSLFLLTQAVCRSCGTQCPSPRARTKSPRSRTARRSPPFSTSPRQSCSPFSLSLSLSLSVVWLRSLKCVRLRALRRRKKRDLFLFFPNLNLGGKRKFPSTRGGGGRKAYRRSGEQGEVEGGGEGTIPARCPESDCGPYVLDKVEGIGISSCASCTIRVLCSSCPRGGL